NDLEGEARRTHGVDFLRETAEDPGIAALQTHDASMTTGGVDDHPVDVSLPRARATGRLPDVDDLGPDSHVIEPLSRNETIVDHGVGLAETPERLHRDELGIARTST